MPVLLWEGMMVSISDVLGLFEALPFVHVTRLLEKPSYPVQLQTCYSPNIGIDCRDECCTILIRGRLLLRG